MSVDIPLLLEPEALESLLGNDNLIVVDLCHQALYRQKHIPGAVHLQTRSTDGWHSAVSWQASLDATAASNYPSTWHRRRQPRRDLR